jgi:hypothetical protein
MAVQPEKTDGMVKLEGAAEKDSRGLFLKFAGKKIWDGEAKEAISGDRVIQGVVIRFAGGYIHGGKDPEGNGQPAIECADSHTEWWDSGYLHREDGPAVVSDFGDWEEYWDHGKLVSIFYRPPDKDWGLT